MEKGEVQGGVEGLWGEEEREDVRRAWGELLGLLKGGSE